MIRIIVGFVGVLVLVVASPFTHANGQVIFSDNFDSGLNAAWVPSGPCTWSIINGQLRTADFNCQTHCYMRVGDNSWTDYRLELDMRGDAGQDKVFSFRGYGINFRTAPNNDIHLTGDGEDLVASYVNYNGTTYHFKVELVGPRIKVYINNVIIFDHVDHTSPSLSGGISLDLYSGGPCAADVRFDNVVVSKMYERPVVLVHGWTGSAGSWGQFKQWLENDGFAYVWPVSINPCGVSGEKDFDKNAEILSNQIETQLNTLSTQLGYPVRVFDIVAHSMGGLVARRYISPGSYSNSWSMFSKGRMVRHLIMLGTPNMGTALANMTLNDIGKLGSNALTLIKSRCIGPAKSELTTGSVAAFNKRYADNIITRYQVVAGTFCYCARSGSLKECGRGFLEACPHDGVVSQKSVIGPGGRYSAALWPLTHSDLLNSRGLAHNVGLAVASEMSSSFSGEIPVAAMDSDSSAEIVESTCSGSKGLVISDGIWTEDVLDIPSSSNLTISVDSYGAPIAMIVRSPFGTEYDSLSTLADSSVVYVSDSNGCVLHVEAPSPGNWTVALLADSLPAQSWPVLLSWNSDDGTTMSVSATPTICEGTDSLSLFTILAGSSTPIIGASVTASLVADSSQSQFNIMLHDDGIHPDIIADDGVYACLISPATFKNENVAITVRATGNSGGRVFSRQASTGVAFTSEFCCVGRVGDVNGSGDDEPTIGDISVLIDALFISGNLEVIACMTEADVNQSGGNNPQPRDITISDISSLIDYLFITGPESGALPGCL